MYFLSWIRPFLWHNLSTNHRLCSYSPHVLRLTAVSYLTQNHSERLTIRSILLCNYCLLGTFSLLFFQLVYGKIVWFVMFLCVIVKSWSISNSHIVTIFLLYVFILSNYFNIYASFLSYSLDIPAYCSLASKVSHIVTDFHTDNHLLYVTYINNTLRTIISTECGYLLVWVVRGYQVKYSVTFALHAVYVFGVDGVLV